MTNREQPGDGGGGFAETGNSYDTIEEAVAAGEKRRKLFDWLYKLPAKERAEWFALNGNANGEVNIDELE